MSGFCPRYLGRKEAAHYLGVSVDVFDDEVRDGLWPAPRRRGAKGGRLTWDKALLDLAADRESGLCGTESTMQDQGIISGFHNPPGIDPGEAQWMSRINGTA